MSDWEFSNRGLCVHVYMLYIYVHTLISFVNLRFSWQQCVSKLAAYTGYKDGERVVLQAVLLPAHSGQNQGWHGLS